MPGAEIELDPADVAAFTEAVDANHAYYRRNLFASTQYGVAQLCRALKARTLKAKKHPKSRDMERISGRRLLEVFPDIDVGRISNSLSYWVAKSDKEADDGKHGGYLANWYFLARRAGMDGGKTASEAAKAITRRNVGLAKNSWMAMSAKARGGAGGGDSTATKNVDVGFYRTNDKATIDVEAVLHNKLKYITNALASTGAVGEALRVAASQMNQKLAHAIEAKKLGK